MCSLIPNSWLTQNVPCADVIISYRDGSPSRYADLAREDAELLKCCRAEPGECCVCRVLCVQWCVCRVLCVGVLCVQSVVCEECCVCRVLCVGVLCVDISSKPLSSHQL